MSLLAESTATPFSPRDSESTQKADMTVKAMVKDNASDSARVGGGGRSSLVSSCDICQNTPLKGVYSCPNKKGGGRGMGGVRVVCLPPGRPQQRCKYRFLSRKFLAKIYFTSTVF